MNHDEAADIVGWKQRKIEGYPIVTAIMLLALRDLKTAKDYDTGVIFTIHKATPGALVRHGWAVVIDHPNGEMHRITPRGEQVLKLFSLPKEDRRRDGICPNCCKQPKHSYPGGSAGYCYECEKLYRRRYRALKRPTVNPDRPCSRCKKRPVHVGSTGRIRTYCEHCMKVHRRKERRRRYRRWRKLIDAGQSPLCYKCKVEPVYYTEKVVYDMCYGCYREYQNTYNQRRADRRRL